MTGNAYGEHAPLISFRNVGVSYWLKKGTFRRERFFALKDISFDLYRGDSIGIIGRNGCGKSTLLRLIAGVMSPDYGQVIGVNETRASLLTLQLGFVDYLSGRENAILSGMFLGMKKKDIESRLDHIIDFSELNEFIDQPLFTYSTGMRARLGFAVAFQLDPDVLLVDEVTGVGDADFRDKSFRVMKDRLNSEASTVVFVSHAAHQVKALCNRVIWIEDGTVKLAGDAGTVVEAYEEALAEKHRAEVAENLDRDAPLFLRKQGYNTLYVLQNEEISIIYSWDDFCRLGGRSENVKVLSEQNFMDLIEKYPPEESA